MEQGAAGAQVQHILPGERVVQKWVVHMREQPWARIRVGEEKERGRRGGMAGGSVHRANSKSLRVEALI